MVWRPAPFLHILSVDAVLHYDGSLLAEPGELLLHLLEHVDHVLRRAIVKAARGPAIPLPEFGGTELLSIHRSRRGIVCLDIERSPAEIPRGHESRVDDRPQ